MSAASVQDQFKSQLATLGRGTLNALFPKDIEAYLLAIELVDSRGATVDYFAWPILPDEIRETDSPLTNIRKTMTAVNVLKNPTFNPKQISLRGDFGRKFKLLIGGTQVTFAGFGASMQSGNFSMVTPGLLQNPIAQFSSIAKSGYGCVKLLEGIKEKSKGLDRDNKPYVCYLYNPILGNNYQVEFTSFTQSQDKDHYNMYPSYNIQLTAVASLDTVLSRKANVLSALKNVGISSLQKVANTLASDLLKKIPL
jgi:hypothetical protein